MINQWGPALLIVFSILVGIIYGNKRLDDLRSEMNAKFGAADKRLGDLQASLDKRFNDLQLSIRSELEGRFTELHRYLEARFKAMEDRLDGKGGRK